MSHQRLFPSFPVPHVGHFFPVGKVVVIKFLEYWDVIATAFPTGGTYTYDSVTDEYYMNRGPTVNARDIILLGTLDPPPTIQYTLTCSMKGTVETGLGAYTAIVQSTSVFTTDGFGRVYDGYWLMIYYPYTEKDFRFAKVVAGAWTLLAEEPVDLTLDVYYACKVDRRNNNFEIYRDDVLKFTVTDTDIPISDIRYCRIQNGVGDAHNGDAIFRDPDAEYGSPDFGSNPEELKPKAFFEVPIIGTGKIKVVDRELVDDSYRPAFPFPVWHSSIIPVDRTTGEPLHRTCLVKVYEGETEVRGILSDIGGIELDSARAKKRGRELNPNLTERDMDWWVES